METVERNGAVSVAQIRDRERAGAPERISFIQ
jgi:hypothetical protein